MNVGRFVGAVLGVWAVRVGMNFLWYGVLMSGKHQDLMAQHPEVFREVIPGFIATDLIFALFLVYLWAKAGAAFGEGLKGGMIGGAWIGLFFGLTWSLYYFFSVTFMSVGDVAVDTVYTLITVAIQGAVAGVIYKASAGSGA